MPAIELSRLRVQIRQLATRFDDPAAFSGELRDFLDQHANRAYRPGVVVRPQPLIPSYRVAPLIMRELEIELIRLSQEQPEPALQSVKILWEEEAYLETRRLASIMLGAIPASQAGAVIEVLRGLARPEENFRMLEFLFEDGTSTLRRQQPSALLALAEEWIGSSSLQVQALGVRVLIPLIADESFQNLPPIYRLLSSLVQQVPGSLQADLQAAIKALVDRSPAETAFFFRQVLPMAQGQATARLIRHFLPKFTPEQQATLRAAIQATNLS